MAATLATTAYALSTITASTSSANPVPISAVGSPMLRAGYLGASSFGETVHPAYPGDLFVLAVINDTWADQVTAVSGGDVTSWHPAARPFFDGSDGQMLQIWYGQVSSTSPTTLSIAWNGTINNADVALEEFSAGANATWSLVGNGISSAPFPALSPGEWDTVLRGRDGLGQRGGGSHPGGHLQRPKQKLPRSLEHELERHPGTSGDGGWLGRCTVQCHGGARSTGGAHHFALNCGTHNDATSPPPTIFHLLFNGLAACSTTTCEIGPSTSVRPSCPRCGDRL